MRNQSVSKTRRRGRRRLRALIAVGSVIGVIVVAILVDSALYYNKVHAGVSVSGLSVGGLTRDEASAALARYVADAEESAIVLTSGDKTWSVMPSSVGTKIDVEGAVSRAMDVTRKSNFFADLARRFKLYFSKTDLPLEGTVDSALLDKVLGEVAHELDVPPVDAGLTIDGSKIKVVEGQKGNVVDQATLRDQLKSLLFTLHATELPVPMIVKDPDVQAEDNQAALEQAQTMISASVTLTNGDRGWTITPEEIAAYMDFTSEEKDGVSTLVPYLSAEKMAPFLEEIAASVAKEPVDASFKSDGNQAWVVPGVPGEVLDPEGTAAALTTAALKTSRRTAEVAVTTTEPKLTTEKAEAMGIKDKLAGYTTEPYYGTANRQVNVRITTQYASDVILAPGREYDFDKQIGPRTEERGYKLAKGIVGQGELADVLGGGICQVSTTLFNAVFEAGLKITMRVNHSLYINHYPPGRDATVTGGGKNFKFVNDTEHYIWIRGTSDGVTTTFNIYGTKDGRTVKATFSGFSYGQTRTEVTVTNPSLGPGTTFVTITGQSERFCTVKRVVTYADHSTSTDIFKSYYPMIPKTIQVSAGTTTTTRPTTPTTESGSGTTIVTEF